MFDYKQILDEAGVPDHPITKFMVTLTWFVVYIVMGPYYLVKHIFKK